MRYGVRLALACAGLLGLFSCGASERDPTLAAVSLASVGPQLLLPGTQLQVMGQAFVMAPRGRMRLHLQGTVAGAAVALDLPLEVIDDAHAETFVDSNVLDALGATDEAHDFLGNAWVEIEDAIDGQVYRAPAISLALQVATVIAPALAQVQQHGVVFVNDRIAVRGEGLLLTASEGQTVARVTGCVQRAAMDCMPIAMVDLPIQPASPLARTEGHFVFGPQVAGIAPGDFRGEITLINTMRDGAQRRSAPVPVQYAITATQVFRIAPAVVSLGQYLSVEGGGFLGGQAGAVTELEFVGAFIAQSGQRRAVSLTLIPEYIAGRNVRYVLQPDDALGRAVNLRTEAGELTGTLTPVVTFRGTEVRGTGVAVRFEVAAVKQVVYLDFRPSYFDALHDFGMRALEPQLRARTLAAARYIYQGVNVEFRTEPPVDFAWFTHVELHGSDPYNSGLRGFDNTVGKDIGNLRLYDRIGGANALTQRDGYPGFGGVFLRSMFGYSMFPNGLSVPDSNADPIFDEIFDEFRPDRGGTPIASADNPEAIPLLARGDTCPAVERQGKAQCAIFVLGNLVGTTVAHELAHSLGLANPDPAVPAVHTPGDAPNRLMDRGEFMPFLERAQLSGQGPPLFCVDELIYLRSILPSRAAPAPGPWPSCGLPGM